jgi:hypothetical protein
VPVLGVVIGLLLIWIVNGWSFELWLFLSAVIIISASVTVKRPKPYLSETDKIRLEWKRKLLESEKKRTAVSDIARNIERLFKYHGYEVSMMYRGKMNDIHYSVVRYASNSHEQSIVIGMDTLRPIDINIATLFLSESRNSNADLKYFITTSRFTDEVKKWAKGKRIVLIDGQMFKKMIDEIEKGVRYGVGGSW